MQQRQQGGTPESGQLVTHWLYIPGLSTTLAPDCYVPDGDYTVPIFSTLSFSYFCVLPVLSFPLSFGLSRNLQCRSALLPACLHSCVPPRQLQSTLPALPACLPANLDLSPTLLSEEHYYVQINPNFTTSCLRLCIWVLRNTHKNTNNDCMSNKMT